MDLLEKKGDSKNLEAFPAGTHIFRWIRLIDIGTQSNERFGKPEHQVVIVWELPTSLDDDGFPCVVEHRHTLSEGQLQISDLKNAMGGVCMVTVVHNTMETASGKRTYANVSAINGVIKGVDVPDQFHNTVIYDMDDHDQAVYEWLPEYIRKLIDKSHERAGTPLEMVSSEAQFEQDVPPDDVPF